MALTRDRAAFLTLFLGSSALAVVYFGARYREWSNSHRVLVAIAFLTIAGTVLLADWYVRRTRGRG